MKNAFLPFLLLLALVAFPGPQALAASPGNVTPPTAPAAGAGPVPVPPAELGVPAETAQTVLTVSPENDILEGAIFDAQGNLLFCDVSRRRVLRLSPGG
ncbi:MAG: hypothetical protein K2G99_00620, partial [Desulfovibrio sp.]|nr:hypothetical protein [Desulfovibrio sp.]